MERYFAEIVNGKVARVIVAENLAWCKKNLKGNWVETFRGRLDHNYAGPGYLFHPEKNNFSAPKPFASWYIDSNLQWQAPVPRKKGEETALWNEELKKWEPFI